MDNTINDNSNNNINIGIIENLRKYRILGIAIFDLVLSFVLMGIIFAIISLPIWIGISSAIPIGILVHYIFGIDTTLNYYLGINDKP